MAEPDPAAFLHRRCQRDIVDQCPSYAFDAADSPQSPAPDQDTPPSRRGGGFEPVVDPFKRVEQLKEENEGRHKRPLCPTITRQFHHLGNQIKAAPLDLAHKRRQMSRFVNDIGVGQQDKIRLACFGHAL